VYLTLTIAVASLITISVVRSVLKMTPGHHPPMPSLGVSECLEGAKKLWAELDQRRDALSSANQVGNADQNWANFRLDWLQRQRDLEARCVSADPKRAKLGPVFRTLETLMDLYTTHAVQYAGEIGPSVDRLRQQLDAAEK
jgi:hypothetical protein